MIVDGTRVLGRSLNPEEEGEVGYLYTDGLTETGPDVLLSDRFYTSSSPTLYLIN